MPSTRFSMLSQSITAAVGHTFGVSAIEPSILGCALPWRDRASIAASFRTSRSGRGDQPLRSIRPSTKLLNPASIASRAAAGSSKPASWVAAST